MVTIRSAFLFLVPALGMLYALTSEAIAGCRINYSTQNNSTTDSVYFGKLQVKSKGGGWKNILPKTMGYKVRKLKSGGTSRKRVKGRHNIHLEPGEKLDAYFNAALKCSAKRQYRFVASGRKGTCQKSIYHPSSTGWITSINVNFGDISQHCR